MKIKYVTLTGADDNINPMDLYNISKKYKYVECGILKHPNKKGISRYPNNSWISSLLVGPNYCQHLCGKYVDDFLLNNGSSSNIFKRTQLNCNNDKLLKIIKEKPKITRSGVILGGPFKHSWCNEEIIEFSNVNLLIDASGGRGISPPSWPEPIIDYVTDKPILTGYAGAWDQII